MTIKIRCFHFYDDGEPRPHKNGDKGCPYGTKCVYTHPADDGWYTAKPSDPPTFNRGSRNSSPTKRRATRRSGGWASDTEDDRRDLSYYSQPRRSPSPSAISTSSRDPGSSRGWQPPSPPPPPPPAVEPMNPAPIEPLVPPPPLPAPPDFLKRSLKEASLTEKEDVWKERFRLMADAYQHRADLLKLEDDLKFTQKMLGEPYPFLPDETKLDAKQKLVELEAQCEAKRNLRDAALMKLSETNFWPILGRTDTEEVQRKKYEDMVNTVTDVHNTVAGIHSVLQTAVAAHNENINGDDSTQRPKKRRRLDDDGEVATLENELSPSELSAVLDKVVRVEGRLVDLQNLIIQRGNNLTELINDIVDAQWEDHGPPGDADEESGATLALAQLKQSVESTGGQMGELAEEVGGVITQVAEQNQETLQLKEKYSRTLGEIAMEKDRLEKQQAENAKIIESLQAGITDLKIKPPPTVSQQYIVDTIETPIKEMMSSKIRPLIEEFQREMDGILHTRNEDYQSLWTKLSVTEKMVTAIAHQVNREQAGLVSPVDIGAPTASS